MYPDLFALLHGGARESFVHGWVSTGFVGCEVNVIPQDRLPFRNRLCNEYSWRSILGNVCSLELVAPDLIILNKLIGSPFLKGQNTRPCLMASFGRRAVSLKSPVTIGPPQGKLWKTAWDTFVVLVTNPLGEASGFQSPCTLLMTSQSPITIWCWCLGSNIGKYI